MLSQRSSSNEESLSSSNTLEATKSTITDGFEVNVLHKLKDMKRFTPPILPALLRKATESPCLQSNSWSYW